MKFRTILEEISDIPHYICDIYDDARGNFRLVMWIFIFFATFSIPVFPKLIGFLVASWWIIKLFSDLMEDKFDR